MFYSLLPDSAQHDEVHTSLGQDTISRWCGPIPGGQASGCGLAWTLEEHDSIGPRLVVRHIESSVGSWYAYMDMALVHKWSRRSAQKGY